MIIKKGKATDYSLHFINCRQTMKEFFLLIVICSLSSSKSQETTISGCPPDELFAPCICSKGSIQKLAIDCSDVQSIEELVNSFSVEFEDSAEFGELTIEDGSLLYLPSDVFKGIKSHEIYINVRRNVNLTDVNEDTFGGLEEFIKYLYMDGNAIEGTHIFPAITKMKELVFVNLNKNRLTSVPKRAFAGLLELLGIDLSNNLISELGREAFADCPKVRNVYLFNNRLMMLPGRIFALDKSIPVDPKEGLQLFLYRNQIDEIAPDTFDGNERKIQITFTENRIRILPRKVFQPLLDRMSKRNDGSIFILPDNPFVCDCRMRWILENRDYFKMLANVTCFDNDKPFETYSLEDLGQCP